MKLDAKLMVQAVADHIHQLHQVIAVKQGQHQQLQALKELFIVPGVFRQLGQLMAVIHCPFAQQSHLTFHQRDGIATPVRQGHFKQQIIATDKKIRILAQKFGHLRRCQHRLPRLVTSLCAGIDYLFSHCR